MADVPKPKKLTHEEQVKRDAMAFAEFLYDVWREKKLKEKKDDLSSNK